MTRRRLQILANALFIPEAALALANVYSLGILLAARSGLRKRQASEAPRKPGLQPPLVVLVPAHDEEVGIGATLASLMGSDYPAEKRRVIVIADNCNDRTAACAAAAGAEVWERDDAQNRGKGHALAWALEQLLGLGDSFAGVVIVDADCIASPNMLRAISDRLGSGTRAMQVDYVAANPEASHVSALRFASFAVGDTVRLLGKERLGLSCGLVGTGMAFSRDLLEAVPWTPTGLVEDGEFHMRLVLAGERVRFVAEAEVSQSVPTSRNASASQQERWEMGKLQLVKRWAPPLISSGLRGRDVQRLHAGLECLVPPQSLVAVGNLGSLMAGLLLGSRRLLGASVVSTAAQAIFVLAGLRLVRAPAYVYRALLAAPTLVVDKLNLYTRLARGGGPTSWVRTQRDASAPAKATSTQ